MAMELATKSPMGWNSFDCFGRYTYEEDVVKNIDFMADNLKDLGYEYIVTDIAWYGNFKYDFEGQKYPSEKHASDVHIDEYGRYIPSGKLYPSGIKGVAGYAHSKGLKFGIHLMRGVSRKAVELKLPIKGTDYTCDMIADKENTCSWCHYNYGVDMSKPGAKEYYQSIIDLVASWNVDFIKYDDITGFPNEIDAVVEAIENVEQKIILSLSPGGQTTKDRMSTYQKTAMVRITVDIWDNQESLDQVFDRLEIFSKYQKENFYLDSDMLCLGHLMLCRSDDDGIKNGIQSELFGGQGKDRYCLLSPAQKRTFMTIRAISASPLMIGSNLPTMGEDLAFVTNKDMIHCNQNTTYFEQVNVPQGFSSWKSNAGYIAIFNRKSQSVKISSQDIAFKNGQEFLDVWTKQEITIDYNTEFEILANDVMFLKVIK